MLNCVAKLIYQLLPKAFPHNLAKGDVFDLIQLLKASDFVESDLQPGPGQLLHQHRYQPLPQTQCSQQRGRRRQRRCANGELGHLEGHEDDGFDASNVYFANDVQSAAGIGVRADPRLSHGFPVESSTVSDGRRPL